MATPCETEPVSISSPGERSVATQDLSGAIVTPGDKNTINVFSGIDESGIRALSQIQNPSRVHQLPSDVADFQGRVEEERELLAALSRDGGAVSLSAINGMGGIGKAVEYCQQALTIFEAIGSPDAEVIRNNLAAIKAQTGKRT